MMDSQNIVLSNSDIFCSEIYEDDSSLNAKFIICDFSVNGNGVRLNRNTISDWVSTLVNKPVVGKIGITDSGDADFTGHNQTTVVRLGEDNKPYLDYEFDSTAVGVFTDVFLEKIDGKEFIVATAQIWKRFANFCAIIKKRLENGTLNTSWEIIPKKFHFEMSNGRKIKVIDQGIFIGHCLLAAFLPPAYPDSQLLEVASTEETDTELIEALKTDFLESLNIDSQVNSQKEDDIVSKVNEDKKLESTVVEPEVSTDAQVEPVKEEPKETAMLTQYDLNRAIRQAVAEKLNIERWDFSILFHFPADKTVWIQKWDALETDVIVFTYEVSETDEVTVSEPVESKLTVSVAEINTTVASYEEKIATLNNSLVEASSTIQTLNTEVSNLKTYKDKFEEAEQIRIANELSEKQEALKIYATKSGFITEEEIESSEDIKVLIENVDEAGIKAVIAERFMKTLDENKEKEIETSETKEVVEKATAKANIADGDNDKVITPKSVMKSYLSK